MEPSSLASKTKASGSSAENKSTNGINIGNGPHVIASDDDEPTGKGVRYRNSRVTAKQILPTLVPLDHNFSTPHQTRIQDYQSTRKFKKGSQKHPVHSTERKVLSKARRQNETAKKTKRSESLLTTSSRKKNGNGNHQDADWLFGDEGFSF